jgi:uncharacterized protein
MSFRDKTTFSMVKSRELRHKERLARIKEHNLSVLPVAAIYGGNASGKSNFFKALDFLKSLILDSTRPDCRIPVKPFKLAQAKSTDPTEFNIVILFDTDLYEYSVSLNSERILEEHLSRIDNNKKTELFARCDNKLIFDENIFESGQINLAWKNTRMNELFLTKSVESNLTIYKPVYVWFRDYLRLIAPNAQYSRIESIMDPENPVNIVMGDMLAHLDTGIIKLGKEEKPYGQFLDEGTDPINFDEHAILTFIEKQKISKAMVGSNTGSRLIVKQEDGALIGKKLCTYHMSEEGSEIRFALQDESDGTQRMIDLLPAFMQLFGNVPRVFIIDELDRSLHTLLSKALLGTYLSICSPDARSQLVFTTHDVLLMDQDLFRRDEMWVTERASTGATSLFSFAEYKDLRCDKDIRKTYLQGRLGGVPRLLLSGLITSNNNVPENKEIS